MRLFRGVDHDSLAVFLTPKLKRCRRNYEDCLTFDSVLMTCISVDTLILLIKIGTANGLCHFSAVLACFAAFAQM